MEDVGSYEECDTFLELYSHCKKGNVEMVETMIDGDGVDVDLRFTHGFTPLMWSARVGCVQAAKILLESGASVSATNEFGATALHEAVDAGSQEVCALLVERNADPNVQDGRGNTPLMLAARCGHGNADVSASVVSKKSSFLLKKLLKSFFKAFFYRCARSWRATRTSGWR